MVQYSSSHSLGILSADSLIILTMFDTHYCPHFTQFAKIAGYTKCRTTEADYT